MDARDWRLDDSDRDELASSRVADAAREARRAGETVEPRETFEVHEAGEVREAVEVHEADGARETSAVRLGVPWETRTPLETYADLRQQTDSGWEPGRRFEAPRAELEKFDPGRAALPATSVEDADRHVADHRAERPWLAATDHASPEARRVIAAADAGEGHGHIRHEGWVTEAANLRRAAYLEDPAQLDPEKRSNSVDGIRPGDKRHACADMATRITDPDAYATAFARGINHPDVREALDGPFDPVRKTGPVPVPISDLLGTDGHKFCTGWQLDPVDGGSGKAHSNRKEWAAAKAEGRDPDVPAPAVSPVPTFEGGHIIFVITRNKACDGYEIKSMYPDPPDGG